MHEWCPIDTAPRDRHLLLGYKVENGRERYGNVTGRLFLVILMNIFYYGKNIYIFVG